MPEHCIRRFMPFENRERRRISAPPPLLFVSASARFADDHFAYLTRGRAYEDIHACSHTVVELLIGCRCAENQSTIQVETVNRAARRYLNACGACIGMNRAEHGHLEDIDIHNDHEGGHSYYTIPSRYAAAVGQLDGHVPIIVTKGRDCCGKPTRRDVRLAGFKPKAIGEDDIVKEMISCDRGFACSPDQLTVIGAIIGVLKQGENRRLGHHVQVSEDKKQEKITLDMAINV